MKHPVRHKESSNPYLEREVQITRLRDMLIFLPLLGGAYFLSPIVDMVFANEAIFGVPAKFVQIFFFWFVIILALRMTNRFLRRKLEERKL